MGDKSQPSAQAGQSSKAAGVAGEVGVPHSSVDLLYFKGSKEPRGDTYSTREGEAKDAGMAGATRIITPNKVRELQIVLYRKCPMNEFGEPNMGNPSVRFDEARERVGHWPCAFQSILFRLLYGAESRGKVAQKEAKQTEEPGDQTRASVVLSGSDEAEPAERRA